MGTLLDRLDVRLNECMPVVWSKYVSEGGLLPPFNIDFQAGVAPNLKRGSMQTTSVSHTIWGVAGTRFKHVTGYGIRAPKRSHLFSFPERLRSSSLHPCTWFPLSLSDAHQLAVFSLNSSASGIGESLICQGTGANRTQ